MKERCEKIKHQIKNENEIRVEHQELTQNSGALAVPLINHNFRTITWRLDETKNFEKRHTNTNNV